jgi:predicted Rossmann-fold nucleotide-binding protein
MPGGMGTMDEFFETLTLIQTGIIKNFPVVLLGKDYFQPLNKMLTQMVTEETISEDDLDLVLLTDDIEEVNTYIQNYVTANFDVKRVKPSRLLREKILRGSA